MDPLLGIQLPNADVEDECVILLRSSSPMLMENVQPVENGSHDVMQMPPKEVAPGIPDVSGTFDLFAGIESPRRSPRISQKRELAEDGKTKQKDKPKEPKPKAKPKPRARKTELERMGQQLQLVKNKNKALRQRKWVLENEVTVLKAKIMTDAEEVASAEGIEQQLDHAHRYIRALKTQVRALGGYAMRGTFESDSEDDSRSDEGELPASFPRGAAKPAEFSLSAMRQRKRARSKK